MFISASLILSSLFALASAAPKTQLSSIIAPIRQPQTSAQAWGRNIYYTMGNPVLTEDVNLYYIWYGNWTSEQKAILTDLGNTIGDSK